MRDEEEVLDHLLWWESLSDNKEYLDKDPSLGSESMVAIAELRWVLGLDHYESDRLEEHYDNE